MADLPSARPPLPLLDDVTAPEVDSLDALLSAPSGANVGSHDLQAEASRLSNLLPPQSNTPTLTPASLPAFAFCSENAQELPPQGSAQGSLEWEVGALRSMVQQLISLSQSHAQLIQHLIHAMPNHSCLSQPDNRTSSDESASTLPIHAQSCTSTGASPEDPFGRPPLPRRRGGPPVSSNGRSPLPRRRQENDSTQPHSPFMTTAPLAGTSAVLTCQANNCSRAASERCQSRCCALHCSSPSCGYHATCGPAAGVVVPPPPRPPPDSCDVPPPPPSPPPPLPPPPPLSSPGRAVGQPDRRTCRRRGCVTACSSSCTTGHCVHHCWSPCCHDISANSGDASNTFLGQSARAREALRVL